MPISGDKEGYAEDARDSRGSSNGIAGQEGAGADADTGADALLASLFHSSSQRDAGDVAAATVVPAWARQARRRHKMPRARRTEYGPGVDVWSLGVLAWDILVGTGEGARRWLSGSIVDNGMVHQYAPVVQASSRGVVHISHPRPGLFSNVIDTTCSRPLPSRDVINNVAVPRHAELFPGQSVEEVLGSMERGVERLLPSSGLSLEAGDFMLQCLEWDAAKRPTGVRGGTLIKKRSHAASQALLARV